MTTAPPALPGLGNIDWDDTGSILARCTPAFDAITPAVLADLLETLLADPRLQAMCERYDFLDKLVLHDDPDAGVRIRLHLYRDGYYDRPHNHRWSFASRILCGQYGHRIFGTDNAFTEDTDPATLRPLCERTETPGSTYALHHASVHTVQASGGTISLLIRGPAAKDRFLILDRAAGGSFWAYGAASETPQQRAAKTMTPAILHDAIGRARTLSGLDTTTKEVPA
jgi:hypothetical protein